MRFSIWPAPDRPYSETVEIVQLCESYGWHAAYYADHFMPNGPDETPLRGETNEALVTLSALAANTTKIRIGTLVAAATYRHPAVLAKSFATLDNVSRGRTIVGLGAGWQVNEHASYGIELGSIGERVSRFEEYVEVVASMLTNETTTFAGKFYNLTNAPCDPRPVADKPSILLGVKGEKRTMALAARFATQWNAWCTPDDHARLGVVLDRHCESQGRDPHSIEHTTQALLYLSEDENWLAPHRAPSPGAPSVVGTPSEVLDTMVAYARAGCHEFIVPTWTLGEQSRAHDTLGLFNEKVVRELA
jgi:alkanesulfonate monooxygenase SsuD/methylene tetrahydromethanopterin reductase-like flavin-dependent oxidoreductase (luciferase family)